MSANPYTPSDRVPPYAVAEGYQYPPSRSLPVVAPVPRPTHAPGFGPPNFSPGVGVNPNDGIPVVLKDGVDKDGRTRADVRELMRTPSPTPSEKYALTHKSRTCDIKKMFDFSNRRQIWTTLLAVGILVLLILFLVYQQDIENWLRPFANWMHDTPGGWLIPIAIMFVLSFPPLFGHEIIAVLCGDVWGVWIGFGIVAAGTFIGELGNFYAFKLFCMTRGKKVEESSIKYALMAQVVREGGFKIPVIMRLSAIPGHFLTAIFSTIGMSVWVYCAAAILGLPKQLATVYIGVSQGNDNNSKAPKIIKGVVITLTIAITHFAMRYIYRRMDEVKEGVIYKRRKARQAKLLAAAGYSEGTAAVSKDIDADLERASTTDTGPKPHSAISMSTLSTSGAGYRGPPSGLGANPSASSMASTAPGSFGMVGARENVGFGPGMPPPPPPERAWDAAERRNRESEIKR